MVYFPFVLKNVKDPKFSPSIFSSRFHLYWYVLIPCIYYYSHILSLLGSRTLTSYANALGTVSKENPVDSDSMILRLKGDESLGAFDFDLHDIASGILHDNTRVMIQLSCDYAEKDHTEIILYQIPDVDFITPISYNSLKNFISTVNNAHAVDYGDAITGGGLLLDVTDEVEEALKLQKKSMAFLLKSSSNLEVKLFAMAHASPDHWPKLIFEDMGVETMHEITYFKE